MARILMAAGAVLGLLAVGLAAYAAHAPIDPARAPALASAGQMLQFHALAVLVAALFVARGAGLAARLAGIGFVLGTVLFSLSITASVLAGVSFGPAAPVGGVLLMASWAALALSALRRA